MQSLNELTQLFDNQRAASRLHHAWIIEGISESEADAWLRDTVSRLINSALDSSHFHPNLFWLNPSDPHNIEAARLAIKFLEKTSWDGGWKICVIMDANQLNTQAQNALLKVMEEPPERSIIFLTSSRAHSLLPTLYSRGMHIVVAEKDAADHIELHTFIAEWIHAVVSILERQDFTLLFALQLHLTEKELTAEHQSKWTLIALKHIIDTAHQVSEPDSDDVRRLLTLIPPQQWIHRWTGAHDYLSKALEFNVDEKHFCIKLTTKILEQ